MVGGFGYALGAGLLEEMKQKIAQMHSYGLSPAQIMPLTLASTLACVVLSFYMFQPCFALF